MTYETLTDTVHTVMPKLYNLLIFNIIYKLHNNK